MKTIVKLREINSNLIKKYKNENDEKMLTMQLVISQILKNDNCFLEISIEEAFVLLKHLGFNEKETKKIYKSLI